MDAVTDSLGAGTSLEYVATLTRDEEGETVVCGSQTISTGDDKEAQREAIAWTISVVDAIEGDVLLTLTKDRQAIFSDPFTKRFP